MEKKLQIKIFRKLPFDELSKEFCIPDSRLDSCSAACVTAAMAADMLTRAARSFPVSGEGRDEKIDYIIRNSEKLSEYMAFLLDEDIRCRGPIRKAMELGGKEEISACCQSASAIASEVVSMMHALLKMARELVDLYAEEIPHHIFEAASFACCAVEAASVYIDSITKLSDDETYIFVTNKENSVFLQECNAMKEEIKSRYDRLGPCEVR